MMIAAMRCVITQHSWRIRRVAAIYTTQPREVAGGDKEEGSFTIELIGECERSGVCNTAYRVCVWQPSLFPTSSVGASSAKRLQRGTRREK